MVVDFIGKSSSFDGMIPSEVVVGSQRVPTIFVVVPSQASFNILLGREWIHRIGFVLHQFIKIYFFQNENGPLEVIEVDQNIYDSYVSVAEEPNKAFSIIAPI